jgi:endonuclease YncB( thermonuclease family)
VKTDGLGSAVLLVLVAAVLLRPWDGLGRDELAPHSAWAYVTRVVDGDTIEVRIGGKIEDVRYIGMLSRVSRPTPRLAVVASR